MKTLYNEMKKKNQTQEQQQTLNRQESVKAQSQLSDVLKKEEFNMKEIEELRNAVWSKDSEITKLAKDMEKF